MQCEQCLSREKFVNHVQLENIGMIMCKAVCNMQVYIMCNMCNVLKSSSVEQPIPRVTKSRPVRYLFIILTFLKRALSTPDSKGYSPVSERMLFFYQVIVSDSKL